MIIERKTLLKLIAVVVGVVLLGGFLFSWSEGVGVDEGLYRSTYILLSHHDNFHMESPLARWGIIILIIASLVILAYLLKLFGEYIINLGDSFKRQKVRAQLSKIKDHYIVCGLGRVGSQVARELADEEVPFVAIDRDEEKVKEALKLGYTAFVGDSSDEAVLQKAHIEQARGLVTALGEDYHNLFVTLAARQINPSLFIVARVNRETNMQRMVQAGADKVALPAQIGAFHMASMVLRPNVVDFLDVLSSNRSSELQIEEIEVPKYSKAVGGRLHSLIEQQTGTTFLALNNRDGRSKVNPTGREILYPGDKLIVMGTKAQLESLNTHI